jgi:hypothetical protein
MMLLQFYKIAKEFYINSKNNIAFMLNFFVFITKMSHIKIKNYKKI